MALYSLGASRGALTACFPHRHTAWEVVLNTKGMGEAEIDGHSYVFSDGTIMCIPPLLMHDKKSEEGFRDLYFHTDSVLFSTASDTGKPIILQDDGDKSMETLLQLMIRLHHQNTSANRGAVNSLHDAAMQLLNGWLAKKRVNPIVERIQNSLVESFANPEIDLKQILQKDGYTPDYVRRLFRQETGMTPGEYLTGLRIGYAKQLIDQQSHLQLSVSHISFLCGYYDPRYFSRIFRQTTGLSPREYMNRQHLGEKSGY